MARRHDRILATMLAGPLAAVALTMTAPDAAGAPHHHVGHRPHAHESSESPRPARDLAAAVAPGPSVAATHDKCKSVSPKGLPPWCSASSSWPVQVGA